MLIILKMKKILRLKQYIAIYIELQLYNSIIQKYKIYLRVLHKFVRILRFVLIHSSYSHNNYHVQILNQIKYFGSSEEFRRIRLTVARNDQVRERVSPHPEEFTRHPYLASRYSPIIYLFILFLARVVQARRTILSSLLAKHSRIERFLSSSPQQFTKLQNAQGYEYATRSQRGRGGGGRKGLQKGDGGCNGTDREDGPIRHDQDISWNLAGAYMPTCLYSDIN